MGSNGETDAILMEVKNLVRNKILEEELYKSM